jgi:hypothetical protein
MHATRILSGLLATTFLLCGSCAHNSPSTQPGTRDTGSLKNTGSQSVEAQDPYSDQPAPYTTNSNNAAKFLAWDSKGESYQVLLGPCGATRGQIVFDPAERGAVPGSFELLKGYAYVVRMPQYEIGRTRRISGGTFGRACAPNGQPTQNSMMVLFTADTDVERIMLVGYDDDCVVDFQYFDPSGGDAGVSVLHMGQCAEMRRSNTGQWRYVPPYKLDASLGSQASVTAIWQAAKADAMNRQVPWNNPFPGP